MPGSVPAISSLCACRYVIWKLCASVILLNIVLGIVIKSYFSAVGFALGGGGNTGDGGVDKLMQDIDRNQVHWHFANNYVFVACHCHVSITAVRA